VVGEAGVFGRDEPQGAGNPVDDQSRVPVEGAEGWFYLPFEQLEDSGEHRITLVREDGLEVQMTLPSFVEQGDELAEIARLVIHARQRWRDLKGLGA
jgi:hypothetical protein